MYKTAVICIVILCGIAWAIPENPQVLEASGKEIYSEPVIVATPANPIPVTGRLNNVLMILESTGDSVGLYDAYNGNYLRPLCPVPNPGASATPINAIQGPDGNIYVSDQVGDAVFMYDTTGTYLGVYANSADGLDNTRGIAFRGTHLFITNGSPANVTKEFSGPHTLFRNFINDGSSPFDILFLSDGKALLADMSASNRISLYDTNGVFIRSIITTSFPEQIQADPVLPGAFLVAAFSSNQVIDFDTTGTIFRTFALSGGRGVYRLGNGNILATYGVGVVELDSLTGAIISTKHGGSGRFIEKYTIATGTTEPNFNKRPFIKLNRIYPNPFTGRTLISYNLPITEKVVLKIYNCLGNEVRTLINHNQTTGNYSVVWDGKDNIGNNLPNGIYICQLKTRNQVEHRQLILVK